MHIEWKKLLFAMGVPLGVGVLSAWTTREAMKQYGGLNQPPLSPPGWVFPVVWTILFLLMGVSAYLILTAQVLPQPRARAMYWYYGQLAVNFFWSLLFFNLQGYLGAFLWLCLLWVWVLMMIRAFYRISPAAGLLQLPYLGWITFAGYLNFGIWYLNR
ncbi:TspO/MBR family protein [Ruminococcus sp.]|uniref:TspO/MBR family protein n=1 Tax=Ruminococcus sp. TaxID=41978 RepID=UPI003EFDC011